MNDVSGNESATMPGEAAIVDGANGSKPTQGVLGDEDSDFPGAVAIRNNDKYRLYGTPLDAKQYRIPIKNYTLSEAEEEKYLFHQRFYSPLSSCFGPTPASPIAAYNDAIQERLNAPIWERAYELTGDLTVSGNRGFVFVNGYLFKPSTAEKPPPYHNLYKRLVERMRRRSPRRIECDSVLLVRHTLGHIYFHTYHDLLTKIVWADELGLDRTIPIVVSAKWADGHYGRHFLKSRLFAGRTVIKQGLDEHLVCNKLYWLRTPQFCTRHLDAVADSFNEEPPPFDASDRIVLIRSAKTHDDRHCDGIESLISLLKARGYSAFDPGTLSINQQKWIFARARHVVGETGSAFTNIVHRGRKDLRLDSIIPSKSATATFQALCKAYGFDMRSHVVHSERERDCIRSFLDRRTVDRIMDSA